MSSVLTPGKTSGPNPWIAGWGRVDSVLRYLLLSLLTAAACLPLVTAPAALAAAQDVAVQRAAGADPSMTRGFAHALRRHLRVGLPAGAVVTVLFAVLAVDLVVVSQMAAERRLLTTVLLAVAVPLGIATAQLPLALRSAAGLRELPRTVLQFVVADPRGSLLRVLLLGALVVLLVSSPPLGLLLIGPWARLVVALERPLP